MSSLIRYSASEDNQCAALAQFVIFFSILSSIALATNASGGGMSKRAIDVALTVLFCLPGVFEIYLLMTGGLTWKRASHTRTTDATRPASAKEQAPKGQASTSPSIAEVEFTTAPDVSA